MQMLYALRLQNLIYPSDLVLLLVNCLISFGFTQKHSLFTSETKTSFLALLPSKLLKTGQVQVWHVRRGHRTKF